MGKATMTDSVSDVFPLEEAPTLRLRGRSGGFIKGAVVRGMHDQLQAFKAANEAVDRLIQTLSRLKPE